jgi:soluble lytic murein transglycosylase-like protein
LAPASITAAAPVLRGATAADSVASYVAEAARRFSIPESWIYAVMRVESAGDPRAVSPKGATGLMQIMPATWAGLRARYGLGGDIYDPHDNIMAGAAFLREMYDRYGAPGFLAAYNAGPGRYENHLATGRPLPAETVTYVNRLAPIIGGTSPDRAAFAVPDPHAWTRAALFAGRSDTPVDRDTDAVEAASERQLVARRPVEIVAPTPVSAGLFIPLSGKVAR